MRNRNRHPVLLVASTYRSLRWRIRGANILQARALFAYIVCMKKIKVKENFDELVLRRVGDSILNVTLLENLVRIVNTLCFSIALEDFINKRRDKERQFP